ncbi:MAG: hypothetical protein HYZ23_02185 [Chloroflexi bacterium]|nr:hypothetical protein [Chloroflexota bacterium]
MSVTRADVESVLVSRAKKRMEFVGMGVSVSGSNVDLADPIGMALLALDIVPANFTAPSDSDLATVAAEDVPKLLDIAELRLLENILGNADKVTLQAASGTEHFGQFIESLEKVIAQKHEINQKQHGVGVGKSVTGTRNLNFIAKEE